MAYRLPLSFACALLAGAVQAAELGEARVSSFIGQPLVADIELTMLEDAATQVGVRLAHPDVYRGANIGMPAVLSTLRMSVMRRDGRQFLHVTSLGPVESEHLHLYLELADGTQRAVRLATLWLSPDPHPAPAPAPVPVPQPVPPPQVAARLAEPAPKPAPKQEPVPKPAPKAAIAPRPVAPPVEPKAAAALPKAEPAPRQPEPAPAGGACAPQPPRHQPQVDACVVLGAKNAMLREQLGQLEDKVRVLQVAVGASPAAVMQPVKPHKPKKKKAEPPPEESSPWLLAGVGAGVLALLAGLAFALRGRKARRGPATPRLGAIVRLKARLKARFGRKAAPSAGPGQAVEEGAHDSSTQV